MRRCAAYLLVAILCLCLLILPIRSTQQSAQVISSQGIVKGNRSLGWLHTDGRYIKNEDGQIVNLRGAAVEEPNYGMFGVSKYWGLADGTFLDGPSLDTYGDMGRCFDWLKSCGVNCVRLVVNYLTWKGIVDPDNPRTPEQAQQYKEAVDTIIRELTTRGIYVYIDHRGVHVYESPAGWVDFVDNQLNDYWMFLQEVAQRYKDNPGVMGIQLMNEPRDSFNDYPYYGYWWDFCLETARKIHAVNPNLLVLVASTNRTVNGVQLDAQMADAGYKVVSDQFVLNPLPEPNILYVFHNHFNMREEWANGADMEFWRNYAAGNNTLAKQQYEDFLYKIAFRASEEYNLPIMNCEFNVKHYNYVTLEECPYDYRVVTRDLLELMNKYGCHWTWWTWGASLPGYPWDLDPDTNLLVYPAEENNPGYPYVCNKLSYLGEIWKVYLNA